jgi:N-acetylmuramic acid 6-phosphate etherase
MPATRRSDGNPERVADATEPSRAGLRSASRAPSRPAAPDFAQLPTEALNPRAARLDSMPAEAVAALMLAEEAKAIRSVQAHAQAVGQAARLVADRLAAGGRLVYVGAGTSGRLGTLDAVECVPTFGIPPSRVVAVMAGGPSALTKSVEGAEDNVREAEQRLRRAAVGPTDVVCGVAASGVTPFVRAALDYARFRRAATIFVTCGGRQVANGAALADVVIALDTGPEVIAGSTRLKAGTATKVVLNAISTAAFVLLGKTYGGLMVDVRPTNAKLWARATRIVGALSGLDEPAARKLIEKAGGRAKVALVMHHAGVSAARARELLVEQKGSLRAIVGNLKLHARPRAQGEGRARASGEPAARPRASGEASVPARPRVPGEAP